jgi:hypothetical protein
VHNCPAFQYWGPAYILSLPKYDAKYTRPERRAPHIRNPRQYGATCKHLQGLLQVYPFWTTTCARWLEQFHSGIIKKAEAEAKKELAGYKKAAAALKARKEI